MQRFAYWLFPLIAVGVTAFVVLFMIQINPSLPTNFEMDDENPKTDLPDDEISAPSWLKRFVEGEEKGYFYPVNEVTLVLGGGEESPQKNIYRVIAPVKDSYQLFCVKQELKKFVLPSSMKKEGETVTVVIESADHDKLQSLVQKLKNYQISANLSPLEEEN